jgi:NMT1/THI5 like
MAKLTLSFISAFNERVDPLMKGIVQAEGIDIVPTYSHPSETFWRQLKFQEFEVGEMSMSSYLIARERGFDIIALPVFPSRRLFHTELSYNTDSGIKRPGDLVGKRIGVGEYQQTAAPMAARHTRTRLWRVAIQSALVHGEDRRVEPRRRHRFHAATGNFISAHTAGQKHGVNARE